MAAVRIMRPNARPRFSSESVLPGHTNLGPFVSSPSAGHICGQGDHLDRGGAIASEDLGGRSRALRLRATAMWDFWGCGRRPLVARNEERAEPARHKFVERSGFTPKGQAKSSSLLLEKQGVAKRQGLAEWGSCERNVPPRRRHHGPLAAREGGGGGGVG